MASKQRSIGSVLATLLLGIIVLEVVVLPFMNVLGGFWEITMDLVALLPFGEGIFEIAVELLGLGGLIQPIQHSFSFSYVLQELAKTLFTIIIYEALCLAVLRPMRLALDGTGNKGADKIKWYIVKVVMAIIAAALAPMLMKWTFANMATLASGWKIFISGLISLILTGGGIAFFVFFYTISIGKAILFVVLKFIVLGGLRLFSCYILVMLALLALQNGLWPLFVLSLPAIVFVIVLCVVFENLIDSIVK